MMGASMKLLKDNKGQSIFEFIVFLPFLVLLFISMVRIQAALNASINQQKAVRSYFFSLLRQNSMLPDKQEAQLLVVGENLQNFGLSLLGYKDYSDGGGEDEAGQIPISSCFELKLLGLEGEADEKCEDPISSRGKAKNIRVYTAFGICSANYSVVDGQLAFNPMNGLNSNSCKNQ
jgi:hypothetical protein